ncbi:hypothetical protein [Alysiella crassa]|uniref:Uncharacterized protein n=2 Tax=Alysiella crassa TaxID=153491 RepID=A0A376BT53_9NEIS|nr:hypothetical protein [Alysiella crassa]UOP08042.1 hypothetical protein LVJ80_06965 [Alysiella crassa]SSY80116.1 Uncharacterised protein [Alysiella crassa]
MGWVVKKFLPIYLNNYLILWYLNKMKTYTRQWLNQKIRELERHIEQMPTDDERVDDEREYLQRERDNYQKWLRDLGDDTQ